MQYFFRSRIKKIKDISVYSSNLLQGTGIKLPLEKRRLEISKNNHINRQFITHTKSSFNPSLYFQLMKYWQNASQNSSSINFMMSPIKLHQLQTRSIHCGIFRDKNAAHQKLILNRIEAVRDDIATFQQNIEAKTQQLIDAIKNETFSPLTVGFKQQQELLAILSEKQELIEASLAQLKYDLINQQIAKDEDLFRQLNELQRSFLIAQKNFSNIDASLKEIISLGRNKENVNFLLESLQQTKQGIFKKLDPEYKAYRTDLIHCKEEIDWQTDCKEWKLRGDVEDVLFSYIENEKIWKIALILDKDKNIEEKIITIGSEWRAALDEFKDKIITIEDKGFLQQFLNEKKVFKQQVAYFDSYRKLIKQFSEKLYAPFTTSVGLWSWLLFLMVLIFELKDWLSEENETTTLNPVHYEPTQTAQHLLDLLSNISEQSTYIYDGNDTIIKKDKLGVYALMLVGGSGTGKSQALSDLADLYEKQQMQRETSPFQPLLFSFDVGSESEFCYQVIQYALKLHRDKGQKVERDFNLTYEEALIFLRDELTQQPGWMILFDHVKEVSWIKNFLQVLIDTPQEGKVIIVPNADIMDSQIKLEDFKKCLQEIGIVFHPEWVNVNRSYFAFDEAKAFQLLERLTTPIYQNEKLTNFQSLLKNTKPFDRWNPGYPHRDRALKKELIKQLGYSPHAIYVAANCLNNAYIRTKQPPEMLLSIYLKELKRQLNLSSDKALFLDEKCLFEPDFFQRLKHENSYYQQINDAVYAIALNRLIVIQNEANKTESTAAKLALTVLPLCLSLNPRHIHLPYLEHYINSLRDKNSPVSLEELTQSIELLFRFGLILPYVTNRDKALPRNYEQFYLHNSLRRAYLRYRIKHPVVNQQDNTQKIQSQKEIEQQMLKEAMEHTIKIFHLKSNFLAEHKLDWPYILHCLSFLNDYEVLYPKNITSQDAVKVLKLINPILNISIQSGYLVELSVLHKKAQPFIEALSITDKYENLLKNIDNHFNDGSLTEGPFVQLLQHFCQTLFQIDPMLPALYAQHIYYYARRCLKTELTPNKNEACVKNIKLACAMRSIIEQDRQLCYSDQAYRSYQDVPTMNHDTITFRRDGLGLTYVLLNNTEEQLAFALKYYEDLSKEGDKHNQSACLRFMTQICVQLARMTSEKLSAKEFLNRAENYLNNSKQLMNAITGEVEQRSAKVLKYHVVLGELELAKAELLYGEPHQHLQKAAEQFKLFIEKVGYDQKNDLIKAYLGLAKINFNLVENTVNLSYEKNEEILQTGIESVEKAIKLQETLVLLSSAKELEESYKLRQQLTKKLQTLKDNNNEAVFLSF